MLDQRCGTSHTEWEARAVDKVERNEVVDAKTQDLGLESAVRVNGTSASGVALALFCGLHDWGRVNERSKNER